MGTVNLGQVAALIKSVAVEVLHGGAAPTVRNDGTKANAELVFGIPDTRNMIINILKNGYIQWPGMKSPLEDTSLHFEGYSWYEVNYRGNFFRAKGDNAKTFSSVRLKKEQVKNGIFAFQADEQQDAIRNITGRFDTQGNSVSSSASGAFYPIRYGYVDEGYSSGSDYLNEVGLDLSKIEGYPIAEENRSRNLTFIVWALVKDE